MFLSYLTTKLCGWAELAWPYMKPDVLYIDDLAKRLNPPEPSIPMQISQPMWETPESG